MPNINDKTTIEAYGHKVVMGDVAESGITYLLIYGLRKSMQDSVAGVKSALADEGKSDKEIAAAIADKMAERLAAITAGTVGVRGSGAPRGDKRTSTIRAIAVEELTASLRKNGAKLPTGDNKIKVSGKDYTRAELVAAYVKKHAERLGDEADRRLEAVETVEIDDLV